MVFVIEYNTAYGKHISIVNLEHIDSFAGEIQTMLSASIDNKATIIDIDIDGMQYGGGFRRHSGQAELDRVRDERYGYYEEPEQEPATRKQRLIDKLDIFIYDTLWAINGGINASFDAGYWAADKYAKWRGKPNLGKTRDGR